MKYTELKTNLATVMQALDDVMPLLNRIMDTMHLVTAIQILLSLSVFQRAKKAEEPPKIKMSDVRGCDEVHKEVEEILEFLRSPEKFQEVGASFPKGFIFSGPPGTGKTMMARAIAAEAGVSFFYAAASSFEEKFVGMGASRLRKLFEKAKKDSPCIVFIDEIDSLCPKRSEMRYSWERQTPNQLLELLDGFDKTQILFICATNTLEALDPALLRPGRLDRVIHFTPPSFQGRVDILSLYLAEVKSEESVDCKKLAQCTEGMTGSELQNIVNIAAIRCATTGRECVTNDDLDWARNRVLMGLQNKSLGLTQHDKLLTAVQKAGQAIVNKALQHTDELHQVTIIPHGAKLGATVHAPKPDAVSLTFNEIQSQLQVLLASRAAEELVFGAEEVSTGVTEDLQRASKLACRVVCEYGMGGLGPVMWKNSPAGEATKRSIDREVAGVIQQHHQKTKAVLENHQWQLHAVIIALLNEDTLSADRITQLFENTATNTEAPDWKSLTSSHDSHTTTQVATTTTTNAYTHRTPPTLQMHSYNHRRSSARWVQTPTLFPTLSHCNPFGQFSPVVWLSMAHLLFRLRHSTLLQTIPTVCRHSVTWLTPAFQHLLRIK
eukprot:TRINITY_DN17700_c0_g1_i1.p1 TRINITY_DN17700_c0_g1~~TRINITY_DN17700_c0_g1_i1.p1  ORF type:complete len:607 (+),score=42.80 TRINITY_DN17700_c0_g1_i1:19-1839(+)